jgi:hypothetical protein
LHHAASLFLSPCTPPTLGAKGVAGAAAGICCSVSLAPGAAKIGRAAVHRYWLSEAAGRWRGRCGYQRKHGSRLRFMRAGQLATAYLRDTRSNAIHHGPCAAHCRALACSLARSPAAATARATEHFARLNRTLPSYKRHPLSHAEHKQLLLRYDYAGATAP